MGPRAHKEDPDAITYDESHPYEDAAGGDEPIQEKSIGIADFIESKQKRSQTLLPFKQSPFPMVEGTSAHASALKHTGEDATHPGPGKEGDEGYHKGHGSAILRPLLPGKVKESEKEKESEL